MRNKEISSYKATRFFNLPQKILQHYVKDSAKNSNEAVKQNWVGSKFFLVKKKMIRLSTVFSCNESFGA